MIAPASATGDGVCWGFGIDPEQSSAAISLAIESGPPFAFGEVAAEGLARYGARRVEALRPYAIGETYDRERLERFQRREPRLEQCTGLYRGATAALHLVETPVQVDHAAAAGALVQAVHVLRDEAVERPLVLEASERFVSRVRARGGHDGPAREAARPVASAHVDIVQKLAQLHGSAALPVSVLVAIVRDARFGAAARAGQHHGATAAQKSGERREIVGGRAVRCDHVLPPAACRARGSGRTQHDGRSASPAQS